MAKTKAQKIACRRARSVARKDDLPRAPSGALSRSTARYSMEVRQSSEAARQTVMDARQRVYGLNAESAGLEEAGTSIGRLYLAKAITRRLYEAANRFAEDVWRYHSMIGIPHPSPKGSWNFVAKAEPVEEKDRDKSIAPRLRSTFSESSPEFAEAVKSASNRYMGAIGAIQQVGIGWPQVMTAVRNSVVMDYPADNYPPHMIDLLARGLRSLADHYGLPQHDDQLTGKTKSAHAQIRS